MAQTGEESDDGALAAVARELYANVPAEFVPARNARAAEVRRAGGRALATRVKALPKPSVPAWAVGLVARDEPEELDALGELGAELRVAQASANPVELRALGKRRRRLAGALTRTAARLAEERGVPLSAAAQEQVELTWQAVVIEPSAERAVRSLLLVRTLEPGDLGGVALDGALAVPIDDGGTPDDDVADAPAPPRRRCSGLRAVPSPAEDESHEPNGAAGEEEPEPRQRRGQVGGEEQPERLSRDDEDSADSGRSEPRKARGTRAGGEGRTPRRTAVGGKDVPSSRGAASPDEPARTRGDVARETRRAQRELRARERVAKQAHADREEAQEELARVEARVLQVAARAEELRRELEQLEEELEELDQERSAAREEREDAEEREAAAERAVEEVRDRLAELAQE